MSADETDAVGMTYLWAPAEARRPNVHTFGYLQVGVGAASLRPYDGATLAADG